MRSFRPAYLALRLDASTGTQSAAQRSAPDGQVVSGSLDGVAWWAVSSGGTLFHAQMPGHLGSAFAGRVLEIANFSTVTRCC